MSVWYLVMKDCYVKEKEMNVQAGSHARMELHVWINLMATGIFTIVI